MYVASPFWSHLHPHLCDALVIETHGVACNKSSYCDLHRLTTYSAVCL